MGHDRESFVGTERGPERNPLDTTFGPHSRRGEQLRSAAHGGILEISESALTHLTLSTISNLARIAERHPQALRYFPEGSRLLLTAEGDSGDYTESGYLNAYCELKYPGSNGSMKSSGRETFYRSSARAGSVEAGFERFIELIENQSLDSNGGAV